MANPAHHPSARDYVQVAAQMDSYEIQAGHTAVTESQNPDVKRFAEMMVSDHTGSLAALRDAAARANETPPPLGLGQEQSQMLQSLQSLKGADFDKAYMRQQVNAHHAALVTHRGYADGGSAQPLKDTARSAVALVERHLQTAEQLSGRLGG